MPIFEYQCELCDHQFEVLIRGTELLGCPQCGSVKLEKLFSTTAAHVTGHHVNLPVTSACPPSDAPPCGPGCCRL